MANQAGAAPPPPQTQPVREQNLDESGLIRVHEQGTANVNVTSGSLAISGQVDVANFPTDGQGNLKVTSQQSDPKTFALFEGTITPSEVIRTQFVDVAGCRDFTLFVLNGGQSDTGGFREVEASILISPDGTNMHGKMPPFKPFSSTVEGGQVNIAVRFTTGMESANNFFGTSLIGTFTPFAAAEIRSRGDLPARDIEVTLTCI